MLIILNVFCFFYKEDFIKKTSKTLNYHYLHNIHNPPPHRISGVVGRERMGTAFPHKKLSGNGVPTREILRDIFLLAIFHYRHVMTFSAHETISKLDFRICKVLAH